MEEVLRSNRRRVYPIQPHASLYTHFSQKYMGYLLPALLQVTNGGSKENEIEKKVRLEVDMALVVSAGSFGWSRALQRKLEQDRSTRRPHRSITMGTGTKGGNYFSIASQYIPRPLAPAEVTRPRRVRGTSWRSMKAFGGKEEILCRVRVLRRILPGGSEMDVCELLSEVESYVVHLQLQVNILRSLVAAK